MSGSVLYHNCCDKSICSIVEGLGTINVCNGIAPYSSDAPTGLRINYFTRLPALVHLSYPTFTEARMIRYIVRPIIEHP